MILYMAYKKVPPAPCACGCGQTITRMMRNGRIVTFKPGHHKVVGGKPKRSQPFVCKGCGKKDICKGRTAYCTRECYWTHKGFKWTPESRIAMVGEKHKADRSVYQFTTSPRIQRLYMLAVCDGKCEKCGWGVHPEVLEIHHINQIKRDGRRENIELMCPTCHEVGHFLNQSGKYDKTRYKKAELIKQEFLKNAS